MYNPDAVWRGKRIIDPNLSSRIAAHRRRTL